MQSDIWNIQQNNMWICLMFSPFNNLIQSSFIIIFFLNPKLLYYFFYNFASLIAT